MKKSYFVCADLMDNGTNESDAIESVKSVTFKNPVQTGVARVKTAKSDMSRQQSTAITSTVTAEKDFSAIKSPWARQILKRRQSTYDAPRPEPVPNGARAMAVKKRRVSHAAAHPPRKPERVASLAQSAGQLKREATSPVDTAIKTEGDFFFGFSNDEDEAGSGPTTFNGNLNFGLITSANSISIPLILEIQFVDCESKKTVKWADSPIGNISEIAKMVEKALLERKKGNCIQADKFTDNDESGVKPENELLNSSDSFDF